MNCTQVHSYGRLDLAYHTLGSGNINVIALHGFGQSGRVYEDLVSANKDLTIFSFDLFFHADSIEANKDLNANESLSVDEWTSFIRSFIDDIGIERFHLLTYSMGSRLGMTLCDSLGDRIDKLFLIAPDGFIKNNWYRFAVRTAFGRSVFMKLPQYFSIFHRFSRLITRLSLIDDKLRKVAMENTVDKVKCEQLCNTWIFLKELKPDMHRVSRTLEMQSIALEVHLGAYDKIIPSDKILKWRYLDEKPSIVTIHRSGHSLLRKAVFDQLDFQHKEIE